MSTIGVSGFISLIAAGAGVAEGQKGRRATERATKSRQRTAEVQQAQQRRQQIIQARRARAAALSQAESAGVSGGSQVQGVVGSIQSQVAENLSFLNTLSDLDQQRFNAIGDVGKSQARQTTFQALGNLPKQLGF